MKWGCAAISAVCLLLPPLAPAADSLPGAARELARKTAALVGRGESVAIAWRNGSDLNSSELARARVIFEAALRDGGIRTSDTAPVDARITLSENPSQYLLVEEVRKGDDRQIWIAGWKRTDAARRIVAGVTLEKRLIWEQDEPILDVAFAGEAMLVLSPWKLTWFRRQGEQWLRTGSIDAPSPRNPPRDPRGRLRVSGPGFEADLPGAACKITLSPAAMECKAGDDPWVVESGSRSLLVASFGSRNYFDGSVATQTGLRKTLPPFFSAAAVEEGGNTLWLLAMLDGSTQIFDSSLEAVGAISSWGSDITGVDSRCGGGPVVLATRAGDGNEPDAIQAFSIVDRLPAALSTAIDVPGPVTALWPSGGSGALAVVREPGAGKYAAYLITLACGA